jgi:hypothetical protein
MSEAVAVAFRLNQEQAQVSLHAFSVLRDDIRKEEVLRTAFDGTNLASNKCVMKFV